LFLTIVEISADYIVLELFEYLVFLVHMHLYVRVCVPETDKLWVYKLWIFFGIQSILA